MYPGSAGEPDKELNINMESFRPPGRQKTQAVIPALLLTGSVTLPGHGPLGSDLHRKTKERSHVITACYTTIMPLPDCSYSPHSSMPFNNALCQVSTNYGLRFGVLCVSDKPSLVQGLKAWALESERLPSQCSGFWCFPRV